MKPYCEIVSQSVLPALRAMIAAELMEKHKLTQQDVATKMGTSQAAISQYYRAIRGKTDFLQKDKDIIQEVQKLAGRIASGDLNYISASEEFCNICKIVRKKKLICEMHKKTSENLKECKCCLG